MEQKGCKIKDPNDARMSGYLEKKGKMRMVSSWKKYWFVLEGRLLLYYRSRVEYETLSPCKGSINLCPPCEVRPMSATTGAFQISTRSSTFNLRAEDRAEQEKWMQALLGVLNAQNSSSPPTKMSHFRYSLDDLVPTGSVKQALSRQYTLPHRQRGTTKDCILQRVQQLGGHTYGGSLGTISKLAEKTHKKFSPKIPRHKNITKLLGRNAADTVVPVEKDSSAENSSVPVVEQEIEGGGDESLYATVDKRSSNNSSKTNSLMVDNDNYGGLVNNSKKLVETDQNRNSVLENNSRLSGVVVNNENYQATVIGLKDEDVIVVDNHDYQTLADRRTASEYSIEGQYESVDRRSNERTSSDLDQLYEDPDNLRTIGNYRKNSGEYAEPMLPPRPLDDRKGSLSISEESTNNNSSSGNSQETKKNFKARLKRITQFVHLDRKEANNQPQVIGSNNNRKQKRSLSFMNRVLRRKKTNEKEEDFNDPLYDTVDYGIFAKQTVYPSSPPKTPDEVIAGTLEELQKKLVAKRNKLEEILNTVKLPSNSESHETVKVEEDETEDYSMDAPTPDPIKPNLPPRQNARSSSPFHDVPKNNRPVVSAEDHDNNNTAGLKQELSTIDKILDDLEREKITRETMINDLTVKKLIEKFSTDTKQDAEVILRKPVRKRDSAGSDIEKLMRAKNRSDNVNSNAATKEEEDDAEEEEKLRHSDELSKLLEELSKVTCAPLMTPGVTISLVHDNLTDDEWLSLVPVRTRRYSDPDYDVPRPHRSLQMLPRDDYMGNKEEIIPATRFFGPVLAQITTESSTRCSIADTSMSWASMAPDSLEPLQIQQALLKAQERKTNPTTEKDRSISSYASQLSNKGPKTEQIVAQIPAEEEFFPKMQDVFIDSLEPFPEISTPF